ncbi:protein-L-isoaspartate O-methyltransferase [Lysobacter xinjiangensis]|uniref:Protein-L-isoaspartate O-methyltransferase n=1 Tax=Cognatilysobacter xinjiangensis TaxID=546892 RepID=A0ABQ3C2E4_9GAMM|nr:protein-L-isoaspartate O-methyltransferase [Lysobacter xinjiangensis]GGZ65407.1 protein-L-isoaspartate O-methyltransferase [Lysobacter xinjiangensis]
MTPDYAHAREMMVEQQVRPWDVLEPRVIDVLLEMPREVFVPVEYCGVAYADIALPLGHGEFMLKPVVAGRALEALNPQDTDDVLEIGTGSGYVTACLSKLARDVVSIERHADLADAARARLESLGIVNARIEVADALAWTTERRFDAICVNAAVDTIPERFVQMLKPGGRLFIVRGRAPAMEAVRVRNDNGTPRIDSLFETDIPYLAGAAPVPQFHL